jgi:hypothetical protein
MYINAKNRLQKIFSASYLSFTICAVQLLKFWTVSWTVSYLKHYVSETGFSLRLQVIPTQLAPIDRASQIMDKRMEELYMH